MKSKIPVSYYVSGSLELKEGIIERGEGWLPEGKFRLQFFVDRILPAHVISTSLHQVAQNLL